MTQSPTLSRRSAQSDSPLPRKSRQRGADARAGYTFLLPWLLGFIALTVGPMISSLYLSFTNYDLFTTPQWIGLANYRRLLVEDPRFLTAVWVTIKYVALSTPLKLVAALDLSIMVPALTVGGIMLWRRHPWGYVIAVLAAIQASLYVLVLTGGSLVAVERGLVPAPGEIPVWTTLTLLTTTVAVLLLRNVRGEDGSANRGGGAGELH